MRGFRKLKQPDSANCFNLGNLGGGKRDRTDDPLLAKQVLYQLSYAPSTWADLLRSTTTGGSGRT